MIQRLARAAPARYLVPVIVASVSLQAAVLGMYWDVGYHIDHGRDQGVLTLPHLFIVVGLQGMVIAALLHGAMRGPAARNERRVPALGLRLSPGGIVMLVCGGIALLGFPLDAAWHALFGEDVTLWGPTHLFMIGGAGISTLGLWMVMRHGFELGRPRRVARRAQLRVAGALLIGLSTFQAEFDFGVPQFPLRFAALSGLGIGTVGLAAEWGWSHVWMPHPWPASLLPQAPVLALIAALAGSVLGARMSQSLAEPGSARAALPPMSARAVALAA